LGAPFVEGGSATRAADRAACLAALRAIELALDVLGGIREQVDARIAAPLAAIRNASEFVDVQVAPARPTFERRRSVLQHGALPAFAAAMEDGLAAGALHLVVGRSKPIAEQ